MTDAETEAVDGRTTALVAELEQLVRIAARKPQLRLREGEPNCSWSFNWELDLVTVNPEHVRDFAPDFCRGIALHEATHAAVTRLAELLSETILSRLMPLLNVVEDMRIETWMRSRFPGSVPWIRAYNDALFGEGRLTPPPASRQAQFLNGMLELWWYGTANPAIRADVTQALAAVREPTSLAIECQPPLTDGDEHGILAAQRGMWEVVRARILPIWERLVAADRADGLEELARREVGAFGERHGMAAAGPAPAATQRMPASRSTAQPQQMTSAHAAGAIAASLGIRDGDDYLAAWRRISPLSDRLGDELLRVLIPNQRLRWTAGHPSGTRLELRRAMQFSADPRLYRSLWLRPIVPRRRDPAIILLLDTSGSMSSDNRIGHAFDSLVLLTEVCRRIGVAAAVWSFAEKPREELSWTTPIDDAARRRVGRLLQGCDGNTHLGRALAAVRTAFARRPADPRILFVLSDGDPSDEDDARREIGRLEGANIHSIGLGLGPGTAGMANLFPRAVTEIPVTELVGWVGTLIRESLAGGL